MKKHPVINMISSPTAATGVDLVPGSDGDRGCVSCGTVYQGQSYTQYGATATLIADARGRYWCLDCAVDALANVGRRVDERTGYDYPWKFSDTGGLAGQHARVKAVAGAKQCPKCGVQSGDDWRQCGGQCPMPGSPHYDEGCARAFEDACTVGAGVPSRSYTREVAAVQAALAHERSALDILTEKCSRCGSVPCRCLAAKPRKPEFSYVRLPGGKATVTCTCGWKDPLGPVHVSPFDPAEALAAAQAEHPCCPEEP